MSIPPRTAARHTARILDWLGLRLVFILLTLTLFVAVAGPLLWRGWFHTRPPQATSDLADSMTLVITLIATAVGAYGVVAYKFISTRLEEDLGERLEAETSTWLEELDGRTRMPLARLSLDLSIDHWRRYELAIWKVMRYDPRVEENPHFKERVTAAIAEGMKAEEYIDAAGEDADRYLKFRIKNNLAYHLATRRNTAGGDGQRAFRLVEEMQGLYTDVQELIELLSRAGPPPASGDQEAALKLAFYGLDLETIAWVRLRFGALEATRRGEEQRAQGERLLRALVANPYIGHDDRQEFQLKYGALFGLDLPMPKPAPTP